MTVNKYKVVQCEHCETVTYKRLEYKMVRCPKCGKKMQDTPIELFAKVSDAIAFIKQQKLQTAEKQSGWFESFE